MTSKDMQVKMSVAQDQVEEYGRGLRPELDGKRLRYIDIYNLDGFFKDGTVPCNPFYCTFYRCISQS